jgi:hypothetical protein
MRAFLQKHLRRIRNGNEPGAEMRHVHPDDRAAMTAALAKVVEARRDQRLAHRMTARDGRVLWFQTGVHLAPTGTLQGVSVDITALKNFLITN